MTERLKGYEGGEDRKGSEGWETKDNIRYICIGQDNKGWKYTT